MTPILMNDARSSPDRLPRLPRPGAAVSGDRRPPTPGLHGPRAGEGAQERGEAYLAGCERVSWRSLPCWM